jgi:hypothetical protein
MSERRWHRLLTESAAFAAMQNITQESKFVTKPASFHADESGQTTFAIALCESEGSNPCRRKTSISP